MRILTTLALLVLAAPLVLAQAAPQKIQWPVPGRYLMRDQFGAAVPTLLAGPQGVYVLNKGVLARIDPVTLEAGQIAEPFGPLVDLPTDGNVDAQDIWSKINARTPRLVPGALALHANELFALIGDQFVRLHPATLEMGVNKTLIDDRQEFLGRVDDHLFQPAPTLEFNGATLYVMYAQMHFGKSVTLTAVHAATGEILAEQELPTQLNPDQAAWRVPGAATVKNLYLLVQQPSCAWKATPQGIYMLRYGTLGRLNLGTLEAEKVTALLSPITDLTDASSPDAKRNAVIANTKLYLNANLFIRDQDILVVMGDQFFRVDKATLEVLKQSSLVAAVTDLDAQQQRLETLVAYGPQQAQLTDKGLIVTRGQEVVVVDPETGAARALKLPEALTRPLTYLPEPRLLMKPQELKDGAPVNANGVIWPLEGTATPEWVFYAPQYGEFVLTGELVGNLETDDRAQAGQMNLSGVFHKFPNGDKRPGLGTLEIKEQPVAFGTHTVTGTLHKQATPDGEVWTIQSVMFEGEEYVLTGAKAEELTAKPGMEGRAVFIVGAFRKRVTQVPAFGKGYIEVNNYTVPPTPQERAAQQDLGRPVMVTADKVSLYVSRNGLVARFDAVTLEQKAMRDLLLVPNIIDHERTAEEQAKAFQSDFQQRSQPLIILPQGQELIALNQGAGFFRLNADTLESKAHVAQQMYPQPLIPTQCLLVETALFAVSGKTIMAVNAADGTLIKAADLPEKLTHNVFPKMF